MCGDRASDQEQAVTVVVIISYFHFSFSEATDLPLWHWYSCLKSVLVHVVCMHMMKAAIHSLALTVACQCDKTSDLFLQATVDLYRRKTS